MSDIVQYRIFLAPDDGKGEQWSATVSFSREFIEDMGEQNALAFAVREQIATLRDRLDSDFLATKIADITTGDWRAVAWPQMIPVPLTKAERVAKRLMGARAFAQWQDERTMLQWHDTPDRVFGVDLGLRPSWHHIAKLADV